MGRRDITCIEKMGAASFKWDNQALFMVTKDEAVKIVWPYIRFLSGRWPVANDTFIHVGISIKVMLPYKVEIILFLEKTCYLLFFKGLGKKFPLSA